MKLTTWAAASGGTSMEALYLVCGAKQAAAYAYSVRPTEE